MHSVFEQVGLYFAWFSPWLDPHVRILCDGKTTERIITIHCLIRTTHEPPPLDYGSGEIAPKELMRNYAGRK